MKNMFIDKYNEKHQKEYVMAWTSAKGGLKRLKDQYPDWICADMDYKETLEDIRELRDLAQWLESRYTEYLTMQEEPQE